MADFNQAFEKTMGHEGGYVNDSTDRGGETYKGISRVHFPKWQGWPILDLLRAQHGLGLINHYAGKNNELQVLVRSFYRENFWTPNRLNDIPHQKIAEEMFDTGVNMGIGIAARFLQEALNLCNNDGKLYPDISVDGKIGPKTLSSIDRADRSRLFKTMNLLQGERYINILRRNGTQEKFWGGWLNRIICE